MRKLPDRAAICLLACLLLLVFTACGRAVSLDGPLSGSAPVPPQSETPPVPTIQLPDHNEAPSSAVMALPSDPPSDDDPLSTGDVPAVYPDEPTQLTYTVGEEAVTVPALKHYTLHGYSIVYDTEHYICNAFTEGDNYWNSEGNYLSVSMIFGMPMEDALAGLRLQEGIAMEPESTTVGAGNYSVQTLYLTSAVGLYRQFWLLDCGGGDLLLMEQSYDTLSDDAALYCASQLAMLDTLTLLY